MALLKVLWSREGDGLVSPATIYYTLRIVMLCLCFVLQDWAIHELVHSPRKRKDAVTLVASSYVTWTFQTHTFSNSVETLIVLWSLVLMQRIAGIGTGTAPLSPSEEKQGLSSDAVPRRLFVMSGLILGFLIVFGVFNRITFPAFLLIPGMQLLPHLLKRCVLTHLTFPIANHRQACGFDSTPYVHCFLALRCHCNRYSLLYWTCCNDFVFSIVQLHS